jgi:hypothetical protein
MSRTPAAPPKGGFKMNDAQKEILYELKAISGDLTKINANLEKIIAWHEREAKIKDRVAMGKDSRPMAG